MSSFAASVNTSNQVELEWTTLSEVYNYGFEVQRKTQGQSYQTLANSFIAGHGTTLEPHTYIYTDPTVTSGVWYYRLEQIDLNAKKSFGYEIKVDVGALNVREKVIPTEYVLKQNFPNPFNPTTSVSFDIPSESRVTLKVYNTLGQEIAILAEGVRSSGTYTSVWNPGTVTSGMYFYKLEATSLANPSRSFTQVKKMLLIK